MLDYTKIESRLKSFLKNNKRLSFSVALLVTFLINGDFSYTDEALKVPVVTRQELQDKIIAEQDNVAQLIKDTERNENEIELKIKKLTQRAEFWVKPLDKSYQLFFVADWGKFSRNKSNTASNFNGVEYSTEVGQENGYGQYANGKYLGMYGIVKNPIEFVDKIDFGANITPKSVPEKTITEKTVNPRSITLPNVAVPTINVGTITMSTPATLSLSLPPNPGNPNIDVTPPNAIAALGSINVAAVPAINVNPVIPEIGEAPTLNPVSVSAPSLPGGFNPRLINPPVVEELKVVVPPVPNPPATDVAFQNVPNNNTGLNTATNSLGNNGIICQLDLTAGTYDMYFRGAGYQQDYSFSGAAAAPFTPSSGGLALPSSVSGNFSGYAFFAMGGKALATIGSGVTVNIVGNNQGGALNTVYYMGNNSAAGNPESKLVNYGTTNLYGNKIAVVNIDNVSSPGNITFVNEGKIIGHADKGNYHGTPGNTNLGNFIFAAYSYGNGGIDTIENGASGIVKFYAPGSVGWAYTSSSNQSIQRRSINNGTMELYGINSLGIATDGDATPTQMAYADIQLNNPIKMLGDQSVGASIRTQPDTSSTFFDNSTWNIEVGGLSAPQDATNGNKVSADSLADGGSKLNKVEENIGLNFDFTLNTPTLAEQVLKKYKVVFNPDVERSTAIRVGKAKIKLDESANTYSQIKLNGSINIGLLSDGSDAKLVYNNTRNALTLDGTGERNIMFAALNGGETTVKEN